jgi:GTP-binding protein
MKLRAEFAASAADRASYPRWDRVEVAFAGRSNVGKSSLLNALTETKGLARISKTPGRTRAVNFFAAGAALALVDLPGFGYAKMSRTDAARIGQLMENYLTHRDSLVALVLLIDARRGPQAEEIALARLPDAGDAMASQTCEVIVVATKCDKLRSAERASAIARFRQAGMEPIMVSVQNGEGILELRLRIIKLANG